MSHDLFLTTRQKAKIRNGFPNNISTDTRLSKTQISKIILSGGSFGSWLGNLGKKAPTNIAIPLARDSLPGLVSHLISNALNKFERKVSGKGAVRAEKGFVLFILNEDMNDTVEIIKWLDSHVLIDGVTETIKHEIKRIRRWISWSFVSTFSCFNSAASNFFSSKRYMWKRIYEYLNRNLLLFCNKVWHNNIIISLILIYKNCVIMARELVESLP